MAFFWCLKFKCRTFEWPFRKRKFIVGAMLVMSSLFLLLQLHPGSDDMDGGNRDLLLALGRQGSARDVHGHKFKYLGIDGKWIPVSDSPTAAADVPAAIVTNGNHVDKDGYNLDSPSRMDSSRGQSFVIDKLLNRLVKGYFLDIGAGDGETGSITLFFERWRQWSGLLVEPDVRKFQSILSKNRKATSWKTCIRTRTMTNFHGQVPCVSMDRLLEDMDIYYIDLLTLNVRSHAFDVIRSMDFTRYNVKVICVELDQDEERSMEYNQMTNFLLQRGYEVKHIVIEKHLHKMDVIYSKS